MRHIDLQTAYATQLSVHGDKQEWVVYNVDKEEIYRLPKTLTEKQVMLAIHLGRKFELLAFNAGAALQKTKIPSTMRDLQGMVKTLTSDAKLMRDRNIMLANELEKLNKQLDEITFKNV